MSRPINMWLATPTPDPPLARCMDVGLIRACWSNNAAPTLITRTVPAFASEPARWRCKDSAQSRQCAARAALGGAFRCQNAVCTQSAPWVPDDGIWDCVAESGAVICLGGQPAAGVPHPLPPSSNWICGDRRVPPDQVTNPHPNAPVNGNNTHAAMDAASAPLTQTAATPDAAVAHERVCVDLSPDFPEQRATAYHCEYSNRGALRRVCRPASTPPTPQRHNLGEFCASTEECAEGLACISSFCILPAFLQPECWYHRDCPEGQRCLLAQCRQAN